MRRNGIILITSAWNFWETLFSQLVITEYLFAIFASKQKDN